MTNLPISGTFRVTCIYGKKGNLWASGYHKGIDLVSDNKNIYATCDGVVKTINFDSDGWGQYVRVEDSKTKNIHIFAHMVSGSIKVRVGQKVSRSTILGTMGTTGNSTGVHLHYQIEKSNTDRTVLDPTKWLGIPNKVGTYDSDDYHIDKKPEPAPKPKEEEEEMTQEQFNTMMNNWIAEQAKKAPGDWSADARAWGEKNGLISGDTSGNKMYKKMLTREEFIAVLYRALHRNIIE
jgi:hypothetical protein